MIHHPSRTPTDVAAKYPAHLHMNLLPRLQRHGMGSLLLRTWLAAARTRGAESFHVGVNRMNTGAMRFWAKRASRRSPSMAPPKAGPAGWDETTPHREIKFCVGRSSGPPLFVAASWKHAPCMSARMSPAKSETPGWPIARLLPALMVGLVFVSIVPVIGVAWLAAQSNLESSSCSAPS